MTQSEFLSPRRYGESSTNERALIELSGEYLVLFLASMRSAVGDPISQFDEWALHQSPSDFDESMRSQITTLHNESVLHVRASINAMKRQGLPMVLVRKGLTLPPVLNFHYGVVFQSELPWFVSAIYQSAFLGNPAVRERRPWKSLGGNLLDADGEQRELESVGPWYAQQLAQRGMGPHNN